MSKLETKTYYADVYFYICPKCKQQVMGKNYFGVFQKAEIGAAKLAGVFQYRCTYPECNATYRSDQLLTNGEVVEVSAKEALSNGLVYDSAGSE